MGWLLKPDAESFEGRRTTFSGPRPGPGPRPSLTWQIVAQHPSWARTNLSVCVSYTYTHTHTLVNGVIAVSILRALLPCFCAPGTDGRLTHSFRPPFEPTSPTWKEYALFNLFKTNFKSKNKINVHSWR